MKKILFNLLLMIAACFGLLSFSPNAKAATPKQVAVNTEIKGTFKGMKDVTEQWYSFSIPSNGYFTIDFSATNLIANGDGKWTVSLYDQDVKNVLSENTNKLISNKITAVAGTLWYIKVASEEKQEEQGDQEEQEGKAKIDITKLMSGADEKKVEDKAVNLNEYRFMIVHTADSSYEIEDNSTSKKAMSVTSGKLYKGNLGMNGDTADYFKFTVNKLANVTLNFSPELLGDKNSYAINIINSNGVTKTIETTQKKEKVKILLKKGTYYISITTDGASYGEYNFKLSAKTYKLLKKPVIRNVKYTHGYDYVDEKGKMEFDYIELKKTVKDISYEVKVALKKNMKKPEIKTVVGSDKRLSLYGTDDLRDCKFYYVTVRPQTEDYFENKVYVGPVSKVTRIQNNKYGKK